MNILLCTLPIERPEATKAALEHLKSRGINDPIQIMGLDFKVSGLETIHPYEVDDPGSGFNMGPKPVGIFLAHYMAWQVAKHLPSDTSLIMENDVKLDEDWQSRVRRAMSDLPDDWDVFYVGSCDTQGHNKRHITGEVYEVWYPQCMHAYIVRRKALGYMMATQRRVYGPVDCTLCFHTWPALKVYTLLPRAADQFNNEISP